MFAFAFITLTTLKTTSNHGLHKRMEVSFTSTVAMTMTMTMDQPVLRVREL